MEQALSGPKKLYAVLNAPVYGTPVDDPFDILADEYFYIQYSEKKSNHRCTIPKIWDRRLIMNGKITMISANLCPPKLISTTVYLLILQAVP